MKLKKLIALFIASMLLLGMFAACSDNSSTDTAETTKNNTGETVAEDSVTEDTRIYANLPSDLDYGGYEFTVLYWLLESWETTARTCRDIYAESQNGEPINDAVYERNMAVEEKFNVKIKLQREDIGTMSTSIRNNIAAGDAAYDAVYPRLVEGASLMSEGLFFDFNELTYVDLSQPWWDQNAVASLSMNNKLYLVATDININDKDATAAIAFNKQIANDYNVPNLYEAVENGTWTYDFMRTVYTDVAHDVNGDGIMDTNDIYGFLGKNDVTVALFNGSGGKMIEKDANDMPYFAFNTERNISATQKIVELMIDADNFFNHQTAGIDDLAFTKMFEEGHGLFFWMRLDEVTNMRASDTDFGILPTPKYSEDQEKYWNTVSRHTTGLLSIPITAEPDRTSVILEALASESKYTLQPAYYEVSLLGKSTRDTESEGMLEIIFEGRIFDLGSIFAFGGFEDQYMGLGKVGAATEVVSLYEKYEKPTNTAIEKFMDKFQ